MKHANRILFSLLAVAPFASAATSLINVDFQKTGTSQGTFSGAAVLGTAGDIWTGVNVSGSSLAATALNYSDGSASVVTVAVGGFNASFDAGTQANVNPAYAALMNDYIYMWAGGGAQTTTVTLSGFQANSLMNIVLYGANSQGQGSSFTYNGTTLTTSDTGTIGATLTAGDEYVQFNNVQANASGVVTFTWARSGTFSAFNGMQIQAVPEPATYGLLGAGALAGIAAVRRRKRARAMHAA